MTERAVPYLAPAHAGEEARGEQGSTAPTTTTPTTTPQDILRQYRITFTDTLFVEIDGNLPPQERPAVVLDMTLDLLEQLGLEAVARIEMTGCVDFDGTPVPDPEETPDDSDHH